MKESSVTTAQERAENEMKLGNIPGNLPVSSKLESRLHDIDDQIGSVENWIFSLFKALLIVAIILFAALIAVKLIS